MKINNPKDYKFIKFEKSNSKGKKYDAILLNKKTLKTKRVSFGAKNYQQYLDSTGLNLYSHLDHLDKKRRKRYLKRHKNDKDNKFSSGWFSAKFLWT